MRLVSFNCNSIRVRLHQLEAVIKTHQPEVIGLQETKVTDAEFPIEEIQALGYHAEFLGQKTHYGVALLSRQKPILVDKGFHHDDEDAQRRFIRADYMLKDKKLTVINCYFPQGASRDHATKFPAKERFYADVTQFIEENFTAEDNVVLMGDMNVAPVDLDIGIGENNRKRWLRDGKTSFLPEEREWLQKIADWGMIDTFRHHHPEQDDLFSWFDYRSRGFERSPRRGLRIDLIMASQALAGNLTDAGIDYDVRSMEKPSDHCPIWSEIQL